MISNTNRVEDRTREREQPSATLQTSQFNFSHRSNGFIPPEDFFDPLSLTLTFHIPFMPRGTMINATSTGTFYVLRHMRRNILLAQFRMKITGVIPFIAAECETFLQNIFLDVCDHFHGGVAFGCPRGMSKARGDNQSMQIIHKDVSHIYQFRSHARALLIQPRIGIRYGSMGVVGS